MEKTIQEIENIIDSNLKTIQIESTDIDIFNKSINVNSGTTVRDQIFGEIRHRNYLSYLSIAWSNHYGIILSPDIVWQIILCEIAKHIKENSKEYANLFTETPEKKTDIIIHTTDPELINLSIIVDCLHKLVPTNTDLFLPKFTTSNEHSTFAFNAAFAEAVTPYYNYMMFLCGIPKVKILGETNDWKLINSLLNKLFTILKVTPKFQNYLLTVSSLVEKILLNYNNAEFWKQIFYLEKCGSGHQVQVKGWINDLFSEKPKVGYIENYLSCISIVPYKNITTNKEFEIVSGLFSSNIDENNYLVPQFGYIINEIKK